VSSFLYLNVTGILFKYTPERWPLKLPEYSMYFPIIIDVISPNVDVAALDNPAY